MERVPRQVVLLMLTMIAVLWFAGNWWVACNVGRLCEVTTSSAASAATMPQSAPSCAPYLATEIHLGNINDTDQVARLERFLNAHEHEQLSVDGLYTMPDVRAVERFQARYAQDIFSQSKSKRPNGVVGQSTIAKINELVCAPLQQMSMTNQQTESMRAVAGIRPYSPWYATGMWFLSLLGTFLLGILLATLYWALPERTIERQTVVMKSVPVAPSTVIAQPVAAAPAVVVAPAPEVVAEVPVVKEYHLDDLKIVEGIGPKIEQLLRSKGITTWKLLSHTDASRLKSILDAAGPRFQMHNPWSWPEQARLASEGKFNELQDFKNKLRNGMLSA